MKRQNEFAVGLAIVAGVVLVVAGALWLGETQFGLGDLVHTARFRTIGALNVGAPVAVQGVKVGRIQALRLAPGGWVEVDMRLDREVELPDRPAVIAASASMFGEWRAMIVPLASASDDPTMRAALQEAVAAGGDVWPGVTLPDLGQLTAEASRIAGDIGVITNRIEGALDSNAVDALKASFQDLRVAADKLAQFTTEQTSTFSRITGNVAATSEVIGRASDKLDRTLGRVDSATADGQLADLFNDARASGKNMTAITSDLRELTAAVRENRQSVVRVLVAVDTLLGQIERGQGTLSLLARDSTLYQESTQAVVELRRLLADIRANPRRYFRFSVF